jgi:hypothetical protein
MRHLLERAALFYHAKLGAVGSPGLVIPLLVVIGAAAVGEKPAAGGGPYESLGSDELEALADEAGRWLRAMNEEHRPRGRALSAAERSAFAGFFAPELLERARVRTVDGIDNPGFYTAFFDERDRPLPIDFRRASGLALIDTVLIVGRRVSPDSPGWLPLLFHELVHLAQVEVQGEDHVAAYVRGWAEGGFRYRDIPQEEQAFGLAARFRAAPDRPFSVADEVRRRFTAAASGRAAER